MNCNLVNYPFLLVSDFSHINFNDSFDNNYSSFNRQLYIFIIVKMDQLIFKVVFWMQTSVMG